MPRPKERITPLLDNLNKIWATMPDMRMCQILNMLAKLHGGWKDNDLFYFEDKDLEIAIEKYMRMHNIK